MCIRDSCPGAHPFSGKYRNGLPVQISTDPVQMPSTSPANAAYSLERLLDSWKIICQEEGKEVL